MCSRLLQVKLLKSLWNAQEQCILCVPAPVLCLVPSCWARKVTGMVGVSIETVHQDDTWWLWSQHRGVCTLHAKLWWWRSKLHLSTSPHLWEEQVLTFLVVSHPCGHSAALQHSRKYGKGSFPTLSPHIDQWRPWHWKDFSRCGPVGAGMCGITG